MKDQRTVMDTTRGANTGEKISWTPSKTTQLKDKEDCPPSACGPTGTTMCDVVSSDLGAFEVHLQQLYLYYKARRRRGQAVVVVSSAWACYNISVWTRSWLESGEFSWFLLLNTVGSVALASACVRSTYRDNQIYVPRRYESRSNGILKPLGFEFEGERQTGHALKRQNASSSFTTGGDARNASRVSKGSRSSREPERR